MEHDAILLDTEKAMTNSFNAVLGATIAVCIVFLFISINFDNFLTSIVDDEENSTTEYNAADKIAAHRSGTYEDHPVPGNYSDNFNGYEDNGRTFDVSITDDMDFDPDEITIYVGDAITWTNNDGMSHTATSTSAVSYTHLTLPTKA